MELASIVLLVIAIVLFLTFCIVVGIYNSLASGKQNIREMFSNISTEYQRRMDLFLRLAEAVKSLKKHEKDTFSEIAKLRSGLPQASTANKIKTFGKIDSLLSGLRINIEAYPELKSNELHMNLMQEIRITEDRINIARTSFNDIVNEYNTEVVTFPSNFFANMFGFSKEDYFLLINQEATHSHKLEL